MHQSNSLYKGNLHVLRRNLCCLMFFLDPVFYIGFVPITGAPKSDFVWAKSNDTHPVSTPDQGENGAPTREPPPEALLILCWRCHFLEVPQQGATHESDRNSEPSSNRRPPQTEQTGQVEPWQPDQHRQRVVMFHEDHPVGGVGHR